MKKILIMMVTIFLMGLLTSCACRNGDEKTEKPVTPVDVVTETIVSETEEDIEEIINTKYDHLSEVRRKNLLCVVTNTDFSLDNAVIITSSFEEIGIGEFTECELVKTEYAYGKFEYTIRIADINGNVFYGVFDSRSEGGRLGIVSIREDSIDGKLIFDAEYGYNPDGWDETNVPKEEGIIAP